MDSYQSVVPAGVQAALQDNCISVLRDWSRSHRVSLLSLSQANPRPEDSPGFAPEPEYLRLSLSQVEQADTVLLLHREDPYRRGESDYRATGITEIVIRNRGSDEVQTIRLSIDR